MNFLIHFKINFSENPLQPTQTMALKKDAPNWLSPYLANVPDNINVSRRSALSYSPSTPLVAKSGVFTLNFGDTKASPTAKTERGRNAANTKDTYRLTVSRTLGFYGVRFEANGFQSWYQKDRINTPVERFYWGIASFDADNACVKQTRLQQARQIIISPELLGLVSGLLNISEDIDLRSRVSNLLPSRLSGFIHWEDMAAEVSFFGVTEEWLASWESD